MISLGGLDLIADLSGALFVPDYRALLVADLHLEKGSSYAARGQALPPYDTRATLGLLEDVIARLKPDRLIALGDSFHDTRAQSRMAADDLARLNRLAEICEPIWITGNHDESLPQALRGSVAASLMLGPLRLIHIPSAPEDEDCEIAGHLHPVAVVTRKGRRIRARCFAASRTRLVMPAFGSFAGGLNVLSPAFSGIFPQGFTAYMIGTRGLHAFPPAALSG